jgi:predicted secreted protein
MLWTFDVIGAGQAPVRALLEGPDAASTGPAEELDFTVRAKPGFKSRVVEAVVSYPAPTVFVKPGDQIKVTLDARAGTWAPQGTSNQLTHTKPSVNGSKAVVTYTAKNKGTTTQVLVANASGTWPNQAYAFSAVVGKGKLPKTVTAAERKVTQSVQLAVGETLSVELPGNATAGYTWALSPLAVDGVIEQVGDVAFTASTDLMGAPGVFTAQFKGVGAGAVPLILLYQGPGSQPVVDGIWMTMVTVQ